MRFVLDTNIAIAALNRHAGVLHRLGTLPARDVGLPLVVVGELTFGARRSTHVTANLAKLQAMRARFAVLPVTESTIDLYATIRADLAARGLAKSDFDLLIACTAIEQNAALVTHDAALLDGSIHGLYAEDWLV